MNLPLSALDLVPLVRGGSSAASLADSVELARALERSGYRRVWYAEHHNMPGIASTSPEIMIAHVAQQTSRIRVGAGGVMLPNHAALKVAASSRLLAALHPGRIDLGLGRAPGTDPWTAAALRRASGPGRGVDFLEQLGELLHFDDGHFPEDHPYSRIRAMPDDVRLPPIWLLGSSDSSAKLAAKLGMGFAFAGHFSPEPAEGPMRDYRDGFRPGALARPAAILALAVFCAETHEAAERMASSIILSFVELASGRPSRLASPEEAMAYAFTPEEQDIASLVRARAIVGTPDVVRAKIEERAEQTAADEIMIATHAFDAAARRRSYELVAQALGR